MDPILHHALVHFALALTPVDFDIMDDVMEFTLIFYHSPKQRRAILERIHARLILLHDVRPVETRMLSNSVLHYMTSIDSRACFK